jgi:hypothetical protein
VCAFAGTFLENAPVLAQQGFAIGREVQWLAPEPAGGSAWRAGLYSGVIEDISGGGAHGSASTTRLIDIATGKSFTVRMDQLTEIRCVRNETAKVAQLGKSVPVCHFGGAVNGLYGLDSLGWMRIKLFDEVVLSDGSTTRSYASYYGTFGHLRLGRGPNQWAKRASPSTPSTGQTVQPGGTPTGPSTGPTTGPTTGAGPQAGGSPQQGAIQPPYQPDRPSGGVQHVPEVGQAYAQALKVGYPATLQAHMTHGDYDTFLFDFAGGPFHAHSRSNLDLVADLLDAEGKVITRSRASGGAFQFNQDLPAGRYGIIIRVMYHGGAGDYELMLGSGAGPRYREQP